MPNRKNMTFHISGRHAPNFQDTIDEEIAAYWAEHQAQPGEVHLDVGGEVGLYTLLAASSGATVYAMEPDGNNFRFLCRNLKTNSLKARLIKLGAWNRPEVLSWRTHSAMSSIPGVGMIPAFLPALDRIEVDTIDRVVERLGLSRLDVIKMDIEGAEIEAIEGALQTIHKFKPLLLIEAYHIRDGVETKDRVINILMKSGIPKSSIKVTDRTLLVAKGY